MTRWHPQLGDYVWWTPRRDIATVYGAEERPTRVVAEALATDFDWIVRLLDELNTEVLVDAYEIRPMAEMEFLALVAARPDLQL